MPKYGTHLDDVPKYGTHLDDVPKYGTYLHDEPKYGKYLDDVPKYGAHLDDLPSEWRGEANHIKALHKGAFGDRDIDTGVQRECEVERDAVQGSGRVWGE